MHADSIRCSFWRLLCLLLIATSVTLGPVSSIRADKATDDYKLALSLYNRKR